MTDIIDTVIFDLGGVLIDWNPHRLYKKIFEDEKERNYFLTEVCSPDWNAEQDAGRPLAEATQILLDQFPDYKNEIKAYYDRWTEMLGGEIQGTVKILEHLHRVKTHKLFALTNWSHETFPYALENFPFLQLFEGILVSGDEKLKKPDAEIYHLTLKRFKIIPQHAVFIDDSLKNIEAANILGINGIHFQSPEQLKRDLEVFGIL